MGKYGDYSKTTTLDKDAQCDECNRMLNVEIGCNRYQKKDEEPAYLCDECNWDLMDDE